MIDPQDVDDDIGGSVLPTEIVEAAVPIALDTLQPWHQPRKQFIRERQWRLYSEHLIDRLEGRPSLNAGKLKYLTLPGIDQFDVEILGELCVEKGLSLEAIGFLAEAEKEPIRARAQVRSESLIKRGLTSDTSVLFPYRLEEVSATNGQAYREIRSRAPFHIINVDACGSIALPRAQHSARIIDALHRLIEIQLEAMRDPWMLFLTTDARSANLSADVIQALKAAIRQNSEGSDAFRDGAISCFGRAGQTLDQAFAHADAAPGSFVSMFSLGLAKWLLHNADLHNWDVKSKAFYCYSTRLAEEDGVSMPCLAFEFALRPVQLEDPFGAVRPNVRPEPPVRPDYSLMALRRASEIVDLDARLNADAALKSELATTQMQLLQDAGYHAAVVEDFRARFLPG